MKKVGTVQSIWRYPVKGMAGESLTSASLGPNGIEGDRIWAVQDLARQEIQSCKFRPRLLLCQAIGPKEPGSTAVEIRWPTGQRLPCTDPEVDRHLSELLGHPSTLQSLRPASDQSFYRRYKDSAAPAAWLEELKATFERLPGEPLPDLDNLPPEMQEYVAVLGSFFLVSPLHLLTTASLDQLRTIHPEADWQIERFRPNVVVATTPEYTGLVEQAWVGRRIRIGALEIDCHDTTPRCGAVVRRQRAFGEDPGILRTIVRKADQNLGVYGKPLSAQDIRVGDSVYLL